MNAVALKKITKEEFDRLENAQKLIWEDESDIVKYYLLEGANVKYGIAKSYDEDGDFIVESEQYDLCVVADSDRVIGLSIKKGNVVFMRPSCDWIVNIFAVDLGVLVVTEICIFLIDGTDYSFGPALNTGDGSCIIESKILPDNQLLVICDDGKDRVIRFGPLPQLPTPEFWIS